MPAAIGPSGRLILQNTAGQVIEAFDGPVIQAINAARQHKKFADRWQALLGSGLTHDQAKRLVYSGFIRPNQSYKGLKNAMEAIGDLPPAGMVRHQAHHELPWSMKKEFAEWGLDVNNPQYGHWVEAGLHQQWNVKNWNAQWREFLDELDPNLPLEQGRQLILQHLHDVMRPQYLQPLPDGCPALWEHSGL